jgi:hypothetical protein
MKVISGGQSGADQTGIRVARELGYETGGTAPLGWRTEYGPAPWLADYGLIEDDSEHYQGRTDKNVQAADGTVLFGDVDSSGSRRTRYTCIRYNKPYTVNPSVEALIGFIILHQITILNVAGNRESVNPEIVAQVRAVLAPALEALRDYARTLSVA